MEAWCERWNINIKQYKTQAIYLSHRRRPVETYLSGKTEHSFRKQREISRCNFLFKKVHEGHIETMAAKDFRTFISVYPLLKSERLRVNTKLTLYKVLIRHIKTYTCPARKFAAHSYNLKLQLLQNKFSALYVIYQGAHPLAICTWCSKFHIYMIFLHFLQNYVNSRQKSYKIMKIQISNLHI
jgi:hypothetical protein